jgi:hypothetical protein
MFSLKFRSQLPKPVASEFENLTARLRSVLTTQHNEDGTHANITTPQISLPDPSDADQFLPVGQVTSLTIDATRFTTDNASTWTVPAHVGNLIWVARVGAVLLVGFSLPATTVDNGGGTSPEFLFINLPELTAPSVSAGKAMFAGTASLRWSDVNGGAANQRRSDGQAFTSATGTGLTVGMRLALAKDNSSSNLWANTTAGLGVSAMVPIMIAPAQGA